MDAVPVFYTDEMLADSDSRSLSASKPQQSWQLGDSTASDRNAPCSAPSIKELTAHDPEHVRAILACEADNGFGNAAPTRLSRYLIRPGPCWPQPATPGSTALPALLCRVSTMPSTLSQRCFAPSTGLRWLQCDCSATGTVKRVMILDCDQHYGDGTEEILQRLGLVGAIDNVTFSSVVSNTVPGRTHYMSLTLPARPSALGSRRFSIRPGADDTSTIRLVACNCSANART